MRKLPAEREGDGMEELLKESLEEYKTKLELINAELMRLYTNGEDWEKEAEKAAGYMIMIEGIEAELKKYQTPSEVG